MGRIRREVIPRLMPPLRIWTDILAFTRQGVDEHAGFEEMLKQLKEILQYKRSGNYGKISVSVGSKPPSSGTGFGNGTTGVCSRSAALGRPVVEACEVQQERFNDAQEGQRDAGRHRPEELGIWQIFASEQQRRLHRCEAERMEARTHHGERTAHFIGSAP